jgi:hypothetical protein
MAWQYGPPVLRPKRKRWPIWLAIGVIVVIAAVAVPVVLLNNRAGPAPISLPIGKSPTSTGPSSSARKPPSRNGSLLTVAASAESPRRWGTTPMYDACALLPTATLTSEGFRVDPAYSVDVMNPDPVNQGGVGALQPNTVSPGSSACSYLGLDKSFVALTIYQQPFFTPDQIQTQTASEQMGVTKKSVNGFDVYLTSLNDPGKWLVLITNQQLAAELSLTLPSGSYRGDDVHAVIGDYVNKVAAGLAQPPASVARFRYAAPYVGFDPCGIFTGTDFQQYLSNGPDDGHPTAQYAIGERELMPDPGGGRPSVAHYLMTQCQRFATALDKGDNNGYGIVANFDTYRTAAEARGDQQCDPHSSGNVYGPPVMVTTVQIGDGAACYPMLNGKDWSLTFRAGRTVCQLWFWRTLDKSQLDAVTIVLTQLAQALASKLESV